MLPRTPFFTFDVESRVTEPVVAGEPKTILFTAKKADETPFSGPFHWTVVRTGEAGQLSSLGAWRPRLQEEKGSGSVARSSPYHQPRPTSTDM